MRKQHTPYKFNPEWFDLTDSKGNRIASDLSIEVAEFIVKACNNHDRLVEAMEELVNAPIDASGNHFDAWSKATELLAELKQER